MTQGPAQMRNTIIDIAYHHACNEGLASLSIRTIAKECEVAVGTIYNYFPDKAALITEVIMKFWRTIAFSEETRSCLNYQPGENLLDFCDRLFTTMQHALEQFIGWAKFLPLMHERDKKDVKLKTLRLNTFTKASKQLLHRMPL